MFVSKLKNKYDVVIIGSGFGSLFALETYRKRFPKATVAIIERGDYKSREWQILNQKNYETDPSHFHKVRNGEKPWIYTIGFGGGFNCWWAQTPRFHPSDFKTLSLYGKAVDWPIDYQELEPFYVEAENRMGVAGDISIGKVLPRSAKFPQPPHKLTSIDEIMRAAQPDFHFPISTARSSIGDDKRSKCCSSAKCNLCPVNAKFTTDNGFYYLLEDASVEIILNSEVKIINHTNGVARSVEYVQNGFSYSVEGELIVLGANAIHSSAILLRSSINDYWVGRGLHEQHSVVYEVLLGGLDNFDGGTVTTALNYSLYDGEFRNRHVGALLYFENRWSFGLRPEIGKWRQTLPLWASIEDLPSPENRVILDNDEPLIIHPNVSQYALDGAKFVSESLDRVLSPLPVEKIVEHGVMSSAAHLQGSLRMGASIEDSVVDKGLLHHKIRNLMVVGTGTIPTSSCANPSLTAAALSIYAVSQL